MKGLALGGPVASILESARAGQHLHHRAVRDLGGARRCAHAHPLVYGLADDPVTCLEGVGVMRPRGARRGRGLRDPCRQFSHVGGLLFVHTYRSAGVLTQVNSPTADITGVSAKNAPPLKVRGSCPDGHVVETTADPGKATKRIGCTGEGCSHTVVCRRVPVAQQAGPPATPTVAPPADDPRQLKVTKVSSYHDQPAAYEPPPAGEQQAADGDADGDADDDGGSPSVSEPPSTEPASGEPQPRARQRFGRRGPRRASTAEHGGQLYPGIY